VAASVQTTLAFDEFEIFKASGKATVIDFYT
jgi:hypothetical protein